MSKNRTAPSIFSTNNIFQLIWNSRTKWRHFWHIGECKLLFEFKITYLFFPIIGLDSVKEGKTISALLIVSTQVKIKDTLTKHVFF